MSVVVQDAVCSMLQTYADFELCSPRGAMLPGPSPREVARLVKKESDSYLEKVKLRKQKVRGKGEDNRRVMSRFTCEDDVAWRSWWDGAGRGAPGDGWAEGHQAA